MLLSRWLETSTADLMVTDLITLKPTDSLADAANVLLREKISGAPVVDADGKCVGVLSRTDLISAESKVAAQQEQAADEFFAQTDLILPVSVYEDKIAAVRDKLTPTAEQPVSRFMVKNLVTARDTDPIEKVVRSFIETHIHRVLVTDSAGKLRGIISTIDVMASLLRVPA